MWRNLLTRIVLIVPTLLLLCLLAFWLSKIAPGDPVETLVQAGSGSVSLQSNPASLRKIYYRTAAILGVDKPVFYFRFSPAAYPDTLYKFCVPAEKKALTELAGQFGNWPQIQTYYISLNQLEYHLSTLPDSIGQPQITDVAAELRQLRLIGSPTDIAATLTRIADIVSTNPTLPAALAPHWPALQMNFDAVIRHTKKRLLWVPRFKWYGTDNQFHHWFSKLLIGDMGKSLRDNRPVIKKIGEALPKTLLLNGLAIFWAYLLALPLGVKAAVAQHSRADKWITTCLFILHSLPVFWIATLAIIFLTTPQYGMDWFPTTGWTTLPSSTAYWQRFADTAWRLTLPVVCLTYPSLALLARQMRGSMQHTLQVDFIKTARAKGLSENKVIWKHAFRNALFPMITQFAYIFPAAVAGSVVIEQIFSIPGMGRLTLDSIVWKDWPVVYGITILAGIMTIVGILIADILYYIADPRIRKTTGQRNE